MLPDPLVLVTSLHYLNLNIGYQYISELGIKSVYLYVCKAISLIWIPEIVNLLSSARSTRMTNPELKLLVNPFYDA